MKKKKRVISSPFCSSDFITILNGILFKLNKKTKVVYVCVSGERKQQQTPADSLQQLFYNKLSEFSSN